MKLLITLLVFFTFSGTFIAQNLSIQQKLSKSIRKGDLQIARELLQEYEPKKEATTSELISYFFLNGEYQHTNGDLEAAFDSWATARKHISHLKESQNGYLVQYHNYLCTYYYELQNPHTIQIHVDSALQLTVEMNTIELVSSKAYLTWINQALAIKITRKEDMVKSYEENYEDVQQLMIKSINFQLENNCNKHDIARSYHRLANIYTDLFHFKFKLAGGDKSEDYKLLARINYDQAIALWTELYGNVHHERARSLYVKAFMNFFIEIDYESIPIYEEAYKAFGLSNTEKTEDIPNKLEVLMFLKYYTKTLLSLQAKRPNENHLQDAIELNELALRLWTFILDDFNNENTSRDIAIYSMNPYLASLEIQLLNFQLYSNYDKHLLFKASQNCKYNDIQKDDISLVEFKNSLNPKELYCDFLPEINHQHFSLFINKDSLQLVQLVKLNPEWVKSMRDGIINQSYTEYTQYAFEIFKVLFSKVELSLYTDLIISPSSFVTDIPFSALLMSSSNDVKRENYKELNYLKKNHKITYSLGGYFTTTPQKSVPLTLNFFTPELNEKEYSPLPFSEVLGENMKENHNVNLFTEKNCSKHNFLSSNSSVLHLSTHGFIEKSLYTSEIILADTVLKYVDIDLMATAPKLAVLNTCNSHLGRSLAGEGTNGFMREFMKNGSQACISNLWEVDDQVSNILFSKFYALLYQGEPSIKALQRAEEHIQHSTELGNLSAPYYWAGHRYVGRDLIFSVDNSRMIFHSWYWLAGLLILVLFTFITYYRLR